MKKFSYDSLKNREIRILSKNGSYLYTGDNYCNNKKNQGLLVAKLPEKENVYHVLLSSLEEKLCFNDYEYELSQRQVDDENFSTGQNFISHHQSEPVFSTFYYMGPFALKKEIILSDDKPAIFIKYSMLESIASTVIKLSPYLAFRNIFALTQKTNFVNSTIKLFEDGVAFKTNDDFPFLHMQISKFQDFIYNPKSNNSFNYHNNSTSVCEDLYTPGYFEMWLNQGESCIFTASLDKITDFETVKSLFYSLKIEKINSEKNDKNELISNMRSKTRKPVYEYA